MTQPSGNLTSLSQSSKNPATEFFKSIMRESGVKLTPNDEPNILGQEQALVVRDIEKSLERNDSDECIERFLRGFKVLIKKEKYLRKALLPTLFKKSNDNYENDVEIQQESLFRIFLKVTRLQTQIIEILLDETTLTVNDDEENASRLRLLLSQLRYLPHIKDPEHLATKLLDIIEISSYPYQLEILDSIPEILPDSEYDSTGQSLAQMLDNNDNLCGAIIDCLNALNLNTEIRMQIQDHILAKMLTGTSLKNFPVFLDFLMGDSGAKSETLVKIRNAINGVVTTQDKGKEKESLKILIFGRLQKAAASRSISDGWLAVINSVKNHTDHKPIDLTILFMLHASTKVKKRSIEAVFRKRIKDGQFKCALLEQLFDKHLPQQLLRDYFTTVVEIGSSLLRTSNDPVVTEFAATLFKLLYNHQCVDRTLKQEILENMILLVGASDQRNITATLDILLDLRDQIAENPNHTIILMRLLEKLDTFDLKDVKLVFEILCGLTCREESLLGMKEELHMIVRKHLSSSKRSLKLRGIISAVVMAKNLAFTNEDQSASLLEDSITINQLKGGAREAAAIVELTNTATAGCSELVALYYDQLAAMVLNSEHLDRSFLSWLDDGITGDFQSTFVTETVCDDIDDLQFSMQYNLNGEDELDAPIAVNIAQLTLKPEKSSIVVLAPHFRALRMLHFKQQAGDLSSINALLGCGVVLPKPEQRDSLGIEQLKQMADCLFHCINWFRETVSAFVRQKDKTLRYKVIQRLDHLNELESLLMECLENIPEHKLPVSYFDSTSQVAQVVSSPTKEASKCTTKPPRKKLKSKSLVEASTTTTTVTKTGKKTPDKVQISFREMDTDLVYLLKYPLAPDEVTSSDGNHLNLDQLNFILKDFVTKLTLLTKSQNLGLLHLTSVSPLQLMQDCVKILPHVSTHLARIIKEMEKLEDHTKETTCFGLILECLSLIFSWTGFQHSKRLDLLRDILKSFRVANTSTPLNSVNHLSIELVERLATYVDFCSELTHAVYLIRTMEAVHTLTPNPGVRTKIAKTAGTLLNKDWPRQNSLNIDILIKSYLSSANISSLCGMVGTLQEEAPRLKSKSDTLDMLKSVTRSNFYVLYRNLWTSLHERVKTEVQCLTNAQHLTLWRTTALAMQGLMTVVKAQETRNNLVCFLKKSIGILKIFLSHGIPIIEIELKFKPDKVVEILKTIQSNTRFLHHLCCYSKLNKDASLMSYVPQFRLTLETLIYRVKAALAANGCSEAFWMGNLKNRDLQGEDILTQSTEATTQEDEEEEDEDMPSEEDSNDEGDSSRSKSGSEVFE